LKSRRQSERSPSFTNHYRLNHFAFYCITDEEQVYAAWRGYRVLSLVSFNVKGAYNGVFNFIKYNISCSLIQKALSENEASNYCGNFPRAAIDGVRIRR
jgi:hypothetical protein